MKQHIENIIKKNLPKKKVFVPNKGFIGLTTLEIGFNQALSQINPSLITDEVLKVAQEEYRKETMQNIHDIIWNKDGSLKSHDISTIVSSVMHYFIR